MTNFSQIYNCFLGKITDDMYLEWTELDTYKDLQSLLINAIPNFEFPKFHLYDYDVSELNVEDTLSYTDSSYFNDTLTNEEINILAMLMLNEWLQRQITSIENTRMKYSGADFKMTSQANHLAKLIELKKETERQAFHLQRLYSRRRLEKDGNIYSNWKQINGYEE